MSAEDREDLRRRLYRPDADAGDLDAYLSTGDDPSAPPRSAGPRDPGTPSARRHRWVPVAAGGAVALAVLLGVVRTLGDPVAPAEEAADAVLPAAVAALPTASVDASTRFVLIRNLLGDHDAGLGTWLDDRFGVESRPGDRFVETHGSGDAVVTIPGSPRDGDGRLTVLLVLAQDGTAGWTTARLVVHDDRTVHLQATSERIGRLTAGVPAIGRLDYTERTRPVRLQVTAPADAEWGVAVLTGP